MKSHSGLLILPRNWRAYDASDSTYRRCPSADKVSKANEDLPAPETPVNPPVQDARPESGKLIQTGTTNWMADVLVRAGVVLLAAGYLLERKRKSMFHKAQH